MKSVYYVMIDADNTTEYGMDCDDDGVIMTFDTEAAAIEEAKTISGVSLVLKATVRVSERSTYRVEKLK